MSVVIDLDECGEDGSGHGRDMKGSPESAAFFRDALAELGQTQAGFAKLLKRKGDDRQPGTILRNIQRMLRGESRVTGEMRVILYLMTCAKRHSTHRAAEKLPAGQAQALLPLENRQLQVPVFVQEFAPESSGVPAATLGS